ncbi:pyridoxamine 5'-phosphate oxidase family protein [Ornithinimicrobium kibberense]|jgi:nitroimidazol reductase NimA-like FMN-containing flavoprotein (pyridoxamine 5'-phosphate oxidase superfamily)|uniref:Pyridoxamine 5'-phosphate oxidase family protein n=1 Tax=Ornithinimicrobium kibberense TaxID=282060 RepID=A0ABV5V5N4_9MICO|nr:pyridoxamine 5'-phosphate oxidase family protein [Ornithinimicrobium kibberense]
MSEQRSTPILSEDECWERLRQTEFGRMAYHLADEVHISPLNYAVDGDRLVFRTAEGSKLLGVAMNEDVAFEVDDILEDEERAWSVIARGKAHILEGDEARDADNLRLRPWVSSAKFNVVAITVEEVSGRDFHLARPWRHMMPPED